MPIIDIIASIQSNLNIALINELVMIFNKMGIDTEAVLRGADAFIQKLLAKSE